MPSIFRRRPSDLGEPAGSHRARPRFAGPIIRAAALLLGLSLQPGTGAADDTAPPTALIARYQAAIAGGSWSELEPGLDHMRLELAPGTRLVAWRIDPKRFSMRIVEQSEPRGSFARDIQRATGAALVLNGGYFELRAGGALAPAGLLIASGRRTASYDPHPKAGTGLLYSRKGAIGIDFSRRHKTLGPLDDAVQVGPLLVDPGGRNGIRTPGGESAGRTAVCLREDGLVALIVDGGIHRYELGAILAAPVDAGGLGCERAINLDGGPSSQAVYLDHGRPVEVLLAGMDEPIPVQNFVVFERKR